MQPGPGPFLGLFALALFFTGLNGARPKKSTRPVLRAKQDSPLGRAHIATPTLYKGRENHQPQ